GEGNAELREMRTVAEGSGDAFGKPDDAGVGTGIESGGDFGPVRGHRDVRASRKRVRNCGEEAALIFDARLFKARENLINARAILRGRVPINPIANRWDGCVFRDGEGARNVRVV